jgi:undecaprenyl-diphosphatase
MEISEWIKVIILGIVEGLTEFLPVSSTGHLIVFENLLHFNHEVFTVFIQLGALAAVWWLFRERIISMIPRGQSSKKETKLLTLVIIGFLPVLIIGYLTKHYRHDSLNVIAWATLVGGIVILIIEKLKPTEKFTTLESLTPSIAAAIGFGQCLALCPGVSRSGATIMTGLLLGLSRPVATEFTFLLASPTMTAVTVYELFKSRHELTGSMIGYLLLGTAVAFVVAFLIVKWLIRFVQKHTFEGFAWYRIAAGALLLFLLSKGILGEN